MDYKLVKAINKENQIVYYFVGFDDWTDFDKIIEIIKNKINPNNMNYQGMTDMNGYFEKDGLYVEIQYDEMIGNYLEFKGDKTDGNLNKIREWAKMIFDNLMISVGGKNA